jgi:hypothetical protein
VPAKYIAILIATRTNNRDRLQIAMLKEFFLPAITSNSDS